MLMQTQQPTVLSLAQRPCPPRTLFQLLIVILLRDVVFPHDTQKDLVECRRADRVILKPQLLFVRLEHREQSTKSR